MSKSGSKALSKSVDSAIKSVESVVSSVLPKNMNMKHVLLAILVGLLLCMLMGNTVEGYEGRYADADRFTGYCYNSGGGIDSTQGCKAKEGAPNYICSDKSRPSEDTSSGTCQNGATLKKMSEFCRQYSAPRLLNKAPGEDGDSCSQGSGNQGNGDYCEVGILSDDVDCSGFTESTCPGAPGLDEDDPLTNLTDGQRAYCKWFKCDGLSTGTNEVDTAFNYPQLDSSLKRWSKCVEQNPNDGWSNIKTDSKDNNPDAWVDVDRTVPSSGNWAIGASTGKAYGESEAGERYTDRGTLHPLIYRKADGTDFNSFENGMFPSNKWSDMFEKKIKFCGADINDDLSSITKEEALDKGAIVGWNHDQSGLICLNNNPAIETTITQIRKNAVVEPGCGSDGDDCYCKEDGCPCNDANGPTPRQLMAHKQKCELGDVTEALNTVNRNVKKVYKDTTDTLKGAVHQTCGTITGFAGTL